MQNNIIILALMTLLALPSTAQIDLHSHAITQGYLDYIKANGAEMDEGFPSRAGTWRNTSPLWTRPASRLRC